MDYDKYYINKSNLIFGLGLLLVVIISFFVVQPLIMNAGKVGNNVTVKGTVYEINGDKIIVAYEDKKEGIVKDAEFTYHDPDLEVNDKIELYYDKWNSSKVGIVGTLDIKLLVIYLIIAIPMTLFSIITLFRELYKKIRMFKFKKDASLIDVDFIDLLPNDNLVMCKGKHPIFLMEYPFNWTRFSKKELDRLRVGDVHKLKVWVDNYDANRYLFEKLKTK